MSKIRIENPRPGCAKYTSASEAERFVRRGQAVLIGQVLHFLSAAEIRHVASVEAQLARSAARGRDYSDVYVSGMVLWNGPEPGGMHRPGEVRS